MAPARILCILPRLTSPTNATRIDMLQRTGYQVEAMAFRRDSHHGRLPNCPVATLGSIRNERYLRRIPTLIGSMRKLRSAIRRSQLVYAFNTDLALTALIAGLGLGKPIVLEVRDIREIQVARGLKGRIVRSMDKFIVGRCRLLIVSSSGYYRYFRDWLKTSTRSLVIETKVEPFRAVEGRGDESPAAEGVPFLDRPLKIGYFSKLRDQWSLDFLECLIGLSNGRFKVVVAGMVSPKIHDFDRFLERNPGIEYRGPYRHPEDMPELYGNVDMILACYPAVIPHGWSHSTRYYESCFFRKPLIVRAGTRDAGEVARHRIGFIIGERRPEDAVKEISAITADDWFRWCAHMAELPPHVYLHTREADDLAVALKELCMSSPS